MSRPVLAVALLLLALAGCSSAERSGSLPPLTPAPSPSTSSSAGGAGSDSPVPSGGAVSASPSPTASIAPVVKPPAADRPDGAGAEAFARYWYNTVDQAYQSLDAHALQEISAQECITCNNFIRDIAAAAHDGDRYVGGGFSVTGAVAAPPEAGITGVLVDYDSAALQVFSRSGRTLAAFPARHYTAEISLTYQRGWRAREVRVQQ